MWLLLCLACLQLHWCLLSLMWYVDQLSDWHLPGWMGWSADGVMSQIRGGAFFNVCFFPFCFCSKLRIQRRFPQRSYRCFWINNQAWWLDIDWWQMSGVMCFLPADWLLCYLDPGKGTEVYWLAGFQRLSSPWQHLTAQWAELIGKAAKERDKVKHQ